MQSQTLNLQQDKTEISGLSYETSTKDDMTNKWFNCDVKATDSLFNKKHCYITGPASSVVYGSLKVTNGKNMDDRPRRWQFNTYC